MPDTAPLAAELRSTVIRLARAFRHQQTRDDLTISQLSVLWLLRTHASLSAGELAQRERVRPPSMTRIIDALEQEDMVRRTANPSDGRKVLVLLTDAGRDRADLEAAARENWLAQQLIGCTPAERAAVAAALVVLNRIADCG